MAPFRPVASSAPAWLPTLMVMDPLAVDEDSVEGALARLLADHPDALVAGVDGRGHFLPLPSSIVSGRHAITDARRALELMVPEDRVLVIATWEHAQAEGMADTAVRLAVPSTTGDAMLHFYDIARGTA